MKKIIALVLALIMTFSVATVAFATEAEVETPATEESADAQLKEMLGEYAWILDVPAGTIAPALKLAMFALKLAKIYIKICGIFNLDPVATAGKLVEFAKVQLEKYNAEETAPAALLA